MKKLSNIKEVFWTGSSQAQLQLGILLYSREANSTRLTS